MRRRLWSIVRPIVTDLMTMAASHARPLPTLNYANDQKRNCGTTLVTNFCALHNRVTAWFSDWQANNGIAAAQKQESPRPFRMTPKSSQKRRQLVSMATLRPVQPKTRELAGAGGGALQRASRA